MRYESVIDAIGSTPLVRLRVNAADGVEVYAKLELQNLFAMKDRVAKQAILEARRTGVLAEGAPIIESSSGTMALGLALVGTYLGHEVHIVTDPRIDPITLAKLRSLGCVVHIVSAMTGQGWQSARLERLAQLMSDLDGAFWPQQYSNPQNPAAYRALAAELTAELGSFDVLVGSVGSGGSLCGSARATRENLPDLHVVAVDCVGSVLFAQPDRPQRKQSGLGNSLQPENIDYSMIDEVHWLSDDEAFHATHELAREQKIFAGNTSGSVYQILRYQAKVAAPGTKLVGIMPDRGDRYVDSVYSAATRAGRAEPTEVAYGTTVSAWSFTRLDRRRRPLLIFVESNTTGTGMLALRTAARLGTDPVFITSNPGRYVGLDDIRCRVIECDTNDPVALGAAVAQLAAGPAPIGGITTTSEFYVIAVAELAARHGVPGNPAVAMLTCRNKALTREALHAAGVGQPRFVVVREVAQMADAVAAVGLPCVVKPADDSGSNDVLLCDDVDTATEHASRVLAIESNVRDQPTARTVLVEEYLPGDELSVEMFSEAGRHTCVGITRKHVTRGPYFVEFQHTFPAELPDDVTVDVVDTVVRALTATGIEFGASHVEVKLTPAGCAVVEINARLAGGMIPELVRLATGIDLLEQQLRAFAGRPVYLESTRTRRSGIRFLMPDRPGTLVEISGTDAAGKVVGVERVTITGSPGKTVRVAENAYDRLGYLIAVGDETSQVEQALATALDELDIVVAEGITL